MVELSRNDFTLENILKRDQVFRSAFWMKKRIEVSW